MAEKCFRIRDLRTITSLGGQVPRTNGVYKWWCKRDLLERFLKGIALTLEDCINDIELRNDFVLTTTDNGNIVEETINDEYYCVYVGESDDLHQRILGSNGHINGHHTFKTISCLFLSTLRQTISSVLFLDQSKENETNEILNQMIIEIFYDFNEDVHRFQNNQINSYFRCLNNDDIDSASSNIYSTRRHYEIHRMHLVSFEITRLRKAGLLIGIWNSEFIIE